MIGNLVLTAGYAGAQRHTHPGNRQRPQHGQPDGVRHGFRLHPRLQCQWLAYVPPYIAHNFDRFFSSVTWARPTTTRCRVKAETKTQKYGLYALFAYTYSRTYDNGLTDGLGSLLSAPYFPLPNWQNLDWALSQINLNNSFTGSVIYDLALRKGKAVR